MAKKRKEATLKDAGPDKNFELCKKIRERFAKGKEAVRHNFETALDDLKFQNGENQWDSQIEADREKDGRPCLKINRQETFVRRIIGDYSQARPGTKIRPAGNSATPQLAEIREGLIRDIKSVSFNDIASDNAVEQMVRGGFGWKRVITKYASDDTFEQIIGIESIRNQFSVIFDPASIKWDKTDAEWCCAYNDISKDVYKTKYKKEEPVNFDPADGVYSGWYTTDIVRIAEYFEKEYETKTIYLMPDGDIVEKLPEKEEFEFKYPLEEFPSADYAKVKKRKVRSYKIYRYVLNGYEILEEKELWPSQYWPFIPYVGPEIIIEGQGHTQSLIRNSKDAQRALNYTRSTEIEYLASVPKSPFIMTPEMIKGHESQWQDAHRRIYPYLLANPDPALGNILPQKNFPPAMSTAITQSSLQSVEEIKATIGMFDASLGARSNETSGIAIQKRQYEGSIGTYIFIRNAIRAELLTDMVILDLMPHVYDTEREINLRGLDNSIRKETINKSARGIDLEDYIENDMSIGTYDVVVTPGTNYATQRMEAADSLLGMIQTAPELSPVVGDLYVKNLDMPGADQVEYRLKAFLALKGLGALLTEQEKANLPPELFQPPPPPPPDPLVLAITEQEQAKTLQQQLKVEQLVLEIEKMKIEIGQTLGTFEMNLIDRIEERITGMLQQTQQPLEQAGMPRGAPGGVQAG